MEESRRPTIDGILERFFTEQRTGKKGLTLGRLKLIEQRLRECVEAEAERVLVPSDLKILAAERQFEPAAAVARTMHADDLVFLLALFVKEPWLPEERVQRTRHLQVTEKLTRLLQRCYPPSDPYSIASPVMDIEIAVRQDRILRSEERRAKRLQARTRFASEGFQ